MGVVPVSYTHRDVYKRQNFVKALSASKFDDVTAERLLELYFEMCIRDRIQDPYFADYRMEQCQQDLAMLTEWKNLNTIQDTRKVSSIEEFKNKKFRYQMSEYSVPVSYTHLHLKRHKK